ncbi:MAG: ABC transporter permease [Burkholderiales bacterium]|nr:ABC transporter permease [Anaerolineae bacterium]
MTSLSQPVSIGAATAVKKSRSAWGDAWHQLTRNRAALASLIFILLLIALALGADVLRDTGFIEGINDQHRDSSLAPPLTCATMQPNQQPYAPGSPQFCFVFGADALGRDVLSRTIYGARVSLAVALIGATISLGLGIVYGVTAGYYGGWVDNLMMRVIDFLYGIPSLVLVILFQTFFKSLERSDDPGFAHYLIEIDRSMGGLFFLFIAMGALSWIDMARLTRGQVLAYKQREFVESARAIGASDRRIIFLHLLPNILGPLIVAETLNIPAYIFTEAFLSFIGLGVEPPTPSWGSMINAGRDSLTAFPNLILIPGAALALTTLAFNFLGDGLRDAIDPYLRGK